MTVYNISGAGVSFTVADSVTVKHVCAFEIARDSAEQPAAQMLAIVKAALSCGLVTVVNGAVNDDSPFGVVATIAQYASEAIGKALELPKVFRAE